LEDDCSIQADKMQQIFLLYPFFKDYELEPYSALSVFYVFRTVLKKILFYFNVFL